MTYPRAVIFGCEGTVVSPEERDFYRESNPLGFILFARNVETPEQVKALCTDLRQCVGRPDAPILIDQEGGEVQRLKPPHWRDTPAPGRFAELQARNPRAGLEAARLNARLIAHDLRYLGIDVNCLPVLDIPQADSHPFLNGRAAGQNVEQSILLGRAACVGLLAGGVLPVIKHIPGHGRSTADSHHDLPRVDVTRSDLESTDFAPFKALNQMPWAMTAHIVYTALDDNNPASTSNTIIENVIRNEIGFEGFLVSDDIGMNALSGTMAERAERCLAAGCDAILHCNGDLSEMRAVNEVSAEMTAEQYKRFDAGRAFLPSSTEEIATTTALSHLDNLLAEL